MFAYHSPNDVWYTTKSKQSDGHADRVKGVSFLYPLVKWVSLHIADVGASSNLNMDKASVSITGQPKASHMMYRRMQPAQTN
jgi:hypothetical protein